MSHLDHASLAEIFSLRATQSRCLLNDTQWLDNRIHIYKILSNLLRAITGPGYCHDLLRFITITSSTLSHWSRPYYRAIVLNSTTCYRRFNDRVWDSMSALVTPHNCWPWTRLLSSEHHHQAFILEEGLIHPSLPFYAKTHNHAKPHICVLCPLLIISDPDSLSHWSLALTSDMQSHSRINYQDIRTSGLTLLRS
jgi:hypothetical protein